ncbi:MAG: DUF465 domain-containing protein [Thermodesulfobacteria bacterium]|nr:DUF465 domain-containing protein [Thermodesulfobacteriota bacterium]
MNKELVKKFVEKYEDIKALFEKHQELEKQVEELNRKLYLNSEEEKELKALKKEKLQIKEQIYELIKKYEGIEVE